MIREFYDDFLSRLIDDFSLGNRRTEAAIAFAIENTPPGAKRFLDIGCGIGWSSQEILRAFPDSTVVGIDLSPVLVDFAGRLCRDPRASFLCADVTQGSLPELEAFDVIVMLDVYEHIAASARQAFNQSLSRLLGPNPCIIMTCPTPTHQSYLRAKYPVGLQPVDEDITEGVLREFSAATGTRLSQLRYVSIWHEKDYLHASFGNTSDKRAFKGKLQSTLQRRERLRDNCGLKVHAPGVMSPTRNRPAICIAAPELSACTETFIRGHIKSLDFDVFTLSGASLSSFDLETFSGRKRRMILRLLDKFLKGRMLTAETVRWFRHRSIRLILAEYGPTGAKLASLSRQARLPLVVHFHGFDAHRESVVEEHLQYGALFDQAVALIAVSQFMRSRLLDLGAPAEKVHYIPYYVDPSEFSRAEPSKAARTLLSVGRFVEKKAPHLTLLAFAEVVKVVPDATLEMVGDGPLLGPCIWLASALNISSAVTFPGAKPSAYVAARMRQVRAFVQHSVRAHDGDCEGTPVAVLEAQCCGLPVIATSHAGIADVVIHEQTGLLAEEGDIASMAQHMHWILTAPPKEIAAMGSQARSRILENFSRDQTLGRLERILMDCLDKWK